MLNACIQHKLKQERLHSEASSSSLPGDQFQSPTSSLSFSQRMLCQRSEGGEETGVEQASEPSQRSHSNSSSSSDEFFEAQESLQFSHQSTPPLVTRTGADFSGSQEEPDGGGLDSPSTRPRDLNLQPVQGGCDPLSLLGGDEDEEVILPRGKTDQSPHKRTGALRPYKDLVLIATGETMFEPVTQVSHMIKL